jgi:pyruvate/2-oxoglutarate dehydrogenase complex dihydrolipoamide dehydrogenase (E3) component
MAEGPVPGDPGTEKPVAESVDDIVVGAGQGGVPLARALAGVGRRVVLVEREHVGGTCINVGCTPTKTMVASARAAHMARRASTYGVHTGPVRVDMETVRGRKRDIVESWRGGSEKRVADTEGLRLIRGHARFTGPREMVVGTADSSVRLAAERVFLDTGSRPADPKVPGLDGPGVLDSTSVMELDVVPEHLLVLGGGPVGLEFAQMFRRFGAQVTLLQRGSRLMPSEDPEMSDAIKTVLEEDGIHVILDTVALRADSRAEGWRLRIGPQGEEARDTLDVTHVLAAAGRTPNTDDLGLDAAGIAVDERGFIPVDEHLRTEVPGVYALGDVKGGPAFTHISYDDFRILRTELIEGGSASIKDRVTPFVVYIDPQYGRVGLTEREAESLGLSCRVVTMPVAWIARALETDETRGLMKALVDTETDRILGAAILAPEGGELMSMLQIAMMGGVTAPSLREAVFAHPTYAESFNNLFAQ